MMNVAAAATESPAICAGFIVRGESAALVDGVVDGELMAVESVGPGVGEIESTTTVSVGDGRREGKLVVRDELGVGVVVMTGREDSVDDEVTGDLDGTVKAVRVGATALSWPRQTLYAVAALLAEEQDAYMHPRATSPSVSPVKL